jgi:hypothetical protein
MTIRDRLRGWFTVVLAVLLAAALEIEYALDGRR